MRQVKTRRDPRREQAHAKGPKWCWQVIHRPRCSKSSGMWQSQAGPQAGLKGRDLYCASSYFSKHLCHLFPVLRKKLKISWWYPTTHCLFCSGEEKSLACCGPKLWSCMLGTVTISVQTYSNEQTERNRDFLLFLFFFFPHHRDRKGQEWEFKDDHPNQTLESHAPEFLSYGGLRHVC